MSGRVGHPDLVRLGRDSGGRNQGCNSSLHPGDGSGNSYGAGGNTGAARETLVVGRPFSFWGLGLFSGANC